MSEKRLVDFDFAHENSAEPKYEQLRNYLAKQMSTGKLKPGQKIPSEHFLVEALGFARTTIRQAMSVLESEGLIRRVQGKGTYVETDALRKLHRGQDIFALVVPETRGGFYPSLLHGFEAAAGRVRHQTIICATDNHVGQQADIVLQLLDKEIGGVALVPTSQPLTPAYQVRQLQKRGIPLVFCHRRVDGIAAPLLAIPFRKAGRLAGKALAECGHRRVAFVTTHRSPVTPAWLDGLREGMRAGGCDAPAELVCIGESYVLEEETLLASLEQLFAGSDHPTALFCSFDSIAEMIYFMLPRLGLQAPRDVSLLGFGGAWRDGILTKRLNSVVIDEIDTGRQAVALLHEMRRGDRPLEDNTEIVLKLDISQGETLAAPASKTISRTKKPMLEKDEFGKTAAGETVDRYTLRNSQGAMARIITYGATVTELFTPDRQGNSADIVLGFDDLASYQSHDAYFGCMVGRVAFRIYRGEFQLDGKQYQLAVDANRSHLHGGPRGFSKVLWQADPVQIESAAAVKFSYRSPDGDQGYPGNLDASVIYSLTENNELQIDCTAATDQPTLINLTHHGYFNLSGAGSGDILNHELQLDADCWIPANEPDAPSGEIAAVAGTPFDFTRPTVIGTRINETGGDPSGYDLCYLRNEPGSTMARVAEVFDPASGRVMEVSTTEPGIVFYTANYLDGTLRGKGGTIYAKHAALCLETGRPPDAIRYPNYPSIVLQPGETYHHRCVYRFSTK